jgi:hypothetical protein
MTTGLKTSCARNANGELVTIKTYAGESGLTCYGCNGRLSHKPAFTRTKNGKIESVSTHFYHVNLGDCQGESIEHVEAKAIIAQHKFDFYEKCERCNVEYNLAFDTENFTVKQEHRWLTGDNNQQLYIPDVAYLDKNDKLKAAVEIYHTHAIGDDKIDAFKNDSIAWVEVKALDVIERFGTSDNRLRVIRSYQICESCENVRQAEKIISEENERLRKLEEEVNQEWFNSKEYLERIQRQEKKEEQRQCNSKKQEEEEKLQRKLKEEKEEEEQFRREKQRLYQRARDERFKEKVIIYNLPFTIEERVKRRELERQRFRPTAEEAEAERLQRVEHHRLLKLKKSQTTIARLQLEEIEEKKTPIERKFQSREEIERIRSATLEDIERRRREMEETCMKKQESQRPYKRQKT